MFDPDEIKATYVLINKPPPGAPPRLNDVLRRMAVLGDLLARTGDGEPGVKTIRLGLQRVMDFAASVVSGAGRTTGWRCVHGKK